MGMTIDLAMNNLSGILTEATEGEDSVCYVTEDDAETLQVAIDTMRKYQKIEKLVQACGADYNSMDSYECVEEIARILTHENVD